MKKIAFLFVTPLVLIAALFAFIRKDEQLDGLFAQIEKLAKDYPQEKVHLQLDKPYYSVGEDIWFKAYVVDAKQNYLSDKSRILYVDLLDERDSVKQTLLLPLENGMTSANMHLNDSLLSGGNYHLYAYTKWMANFGSEYFFKKDIPIVNALHGAVSGTIDYHLTALENSRQLDANIGYVTDNGSPYANQSVSYTLTANGKTLFTDKAITDANGKLLLNKIIKNDDKNTPVVLTTTLSIAGRSSLKQDFVIRPLASVADVQFFPEGGHLVMGLRTKVAFKALKPDGLGESVNGYITDESGERLSEFKSEHAGMGVFPLMPLADKNYVAVIKHEDGSEKRYALPKADASGYVLNVNQVGKDSLSVKISASPGLLNGREAVLIGQSNGVVQFAAKSKLDQASTVSIISTKKIPTGVVQFTLFTPDNQPVAERLVFVDHNDWLTADIKADKTEYIKRGKVQLNLDVTDALGQPVVGSFSVAVTDEGKVKTTEDGETTMLSNLLLTSDIKGYIEQPNYYFNVTNPNRQKYLDQLLLTQGWRRFSWTDLQAGKFPVLKYQHEQSLTVSGMVTTLSNKPVPKGKLTLLASTPNGPILLDTIADENGHYVFTDLDITDSAKLVVRASSAKDRNTVKITIDKKLRVRFVKIGSTNAFTDVSLADYLKVTQARFDELSKFGFMQNVVPLREVKIKDKKVLNADKIVPNSANLTPGLSNKVLRSAELSKQTNLLNAFYGLAGVSVEKGVVTSRNGTMKVLLDGIEIKAGDIASIPPTNVEAVEILSSPSYAAVYQANGVLIITTKKGGEDSAPANVFNVAHSVPRGYSSIKQFYAPAYDTPNQSTKMADLRSTIYWNPDVVTDANGKTSINYFNADGTGTYKVTIEGMDTKGKLLRKTITYAVK